MRVRVPLPASYARVVELADTLDLGSSISDVQVRVLSRAPFLDRYNGVITMDYKKERVKGYEEYSVDTNGIVYSKKDKPLKPSVNHGGYNIVNFLTGGKRKGFAVHTLVANQYIENQDPSRTQVNHRDGNKTNNCADNLEWVTPEENIRHAIKTLGFSKCGDKHPKAKAITGYDKSTGKLKYTFSCIIDAGLYFADGNVVKARHIQDLICKIANGYGSKKSYRGCIWQYEN